MVGKELGTEAGGDPPQKPWRQPGDQAANQTPGATSKKTLPSRWKGAGGRGVTPVSPSSCLECGQLSL